MLEFRNVSLKLSKKYYSLCELSFASENNLVFIGKKDEGNQHILRLISKIQRNYEGQILLDGQDIKNISYKNDIELRFLPENPVFFNNKSVEKNLIYPLKIRKYKKNEIDKIIKELANKYNFENILKTKIKKLNNIDNWLVCLARAIISPAKYYLFDFFNFELLLNNENIKNIFMDIISFNATFYFSCENDDYLNYLKNFQNVKIVNGSLSK